MPANSRIIASEYSGLLWVTDTAANLKKIYEFIRAGDARKPGQETLEPGLGAEDRHAVSAALLGRVQRLIGRGEDRGRRIAALRKTGHADADADLSERLELPELETMLILISARMRSASTAPPSDGTPVQSTTNSSPP